MIDYQCSIIIVLLISITMFLLVYKGSFINRHVEENNISIDTDVNTYISGIKTEIEQFTLDWLLKHNYLAKDIRDDIETYTLVSPNQFTQVSKIIYETNYKSFETTEDVELFLSSLETSDYESYSNTFQLLISNLIIKFDKVVIDELIQSTYQSVSYLNDYTKDLYSEVHEYNPHFWIFIYVQYIINTNIEEIAYVKN